MRTKRSPNISVVKNIIDSKSILLNWDSRDDWSLKLNQITWNKNSGRLFADLKLDNSIHIDVNINISIDGRNYIYWISYDNEIRVLHTINHHIIFVWPKAQSIYYYRWFINGIQCTRETCDNYKPIHNIKKIID